MFGRKILEQVLNNNGELNEKETGNDMEAAFNEEFTENNTLIKEGTLNIGSPVVFKKDWHLAN